jgi:hypothetical protein
MTTTETQKLDVIKQWKYMNPMLGSFIYKNLPEPKSLSDAYRRMAMHKNSMEDIDLQIQIAEINHTLFLSNYISVDENTDVEVEKYESKQRKHLEKVSILLNSKLQHKRKSAAYWYWMQCHDEATEEKINAQLNEVSDG